MFEGFEGFETLDIKTSDRGFGSAQIHLRHGGKGPPLLLLHGNPMTHVTWHRIVKPLAEHFHVVAADLRGYGDSVGPEEGGDNHINYSFRAMAQDQVDVMASLGFDSFQVAGHDRGARTVHRMALDHADKIQRLAIIDIVPSYHVWRNTSKNWAMKSWHWVFMSQPYDMPERMMAGVPAEYFMERKLSKPGIGLKHFDPRAFQEYVRCFNWKTIRGSCEDYRACVTCDYDMDGADYDAGHKVTAPSLLLWGAKSHTGTVYGDLVPVWKNFIEDVKGSPIDCGHYVQEEAPDQVLQHFMNFFDPNIGSR